MKKIFATTFIVLFFLNVFSQTVDEVINKYIQAIGGMEKLNSIQTLKVTGKNMRGTFESPFKHTIKRKTGIKTEMNMRGMEMQMVYDASSGTAWWINPWKGGKEPEKITVERGKDLKKNMDFEGELINYKAKNNLAELVGKVVENGKNLYQIKVMDEDDNLTFYFIDAETYLITKTKGTKNFQGNEAEVETYFSDYREVNGLLFPFVFETKGENKDRSSKTIIEKIEANLPVEDSIFKMQSK